MSEHAVLTAIGEDRPGLVDAVSSFIHHAGCNIEDSRMALLGGEFAMIILLSGDPAAMGRVQSGAAAEGKKFGLEIHLRATKPTAARAPVPASALPYELTAYSMDHPGIVQRVAHYLAERKINIRALDTRVDAAPHTGQPLFSLQAVIDVPSGTSVAELRRGLSAIGAEENIDLELKPAR